MLNGGFSRSFQMKETTAEAAGLKPRCRDDLMQDGPVFLAVEGRLHAVTYCLEQHPVRSHHRILETGKLAPAPRGVETGTC